MSWMTTSKSWVLWRQHDSSSSTKTVENATEEKLQSLLEECGWSLTGEEGKARKGQDPTYKSMVKPEGLGSRNHEEFESGSTLGTTHGYLDE